MTDSPPVPNGTTDSLNHLFSGSRHIVMPLSTGLTSGDHDERSAPQLANKSSTSSLPAGFYFQYLQSLCRRRSWSDPIYETRRSHNGYTGLVLVNGTEYQTNMAYESENLARENIARRAFLTARNLSVSGGMLPRNGVVTGLPVSVGDKRGRRKRRGGHVPFPEPVQELGSPILVNRISSTIQEEKASTEGETTPFTPSTSLNLASSSRDSKYSYDNKLNPEDDHSCAESDIVDRSRTADIHTLYRENRDQNGLYHCPWEDKDPPCNHKPAQMRYTYDQYVDFHLRNFTNSGCTESFISTDYAANHERETHTMHTSDTHHSRGTLEDGDPLGLCVLWQPDAQRTADIIFVHGLGGSSRQSWCKENDPELFWPQKWLAREPNIKTARILSFGYNVKFEDVGRTASSGFSDSTYDLLEAMRMDKGRDRENIAIGEVPVIFIAHSIGGIIVKEAYIIGQNNPKYSAIARAISSILFLATPHQNTSISGSLDRILKVKNFNQSQDRYNIELRRYSHYLEGVNDMFRKVPSKPQITSFYETLQEHVFVDKSDTFLGYPWAAFRPLIADHPNICKYASPKDPNYISVRDWLTKQVNKLCRVAIISQDDRRKEVQDTDCPPSDHGFHTVLGANTDSGYASVGLEDNMTRINVEEDDTVTIFTDNQDLDIAEDIKGLLTSALSNEILQHIRSLSCHLGRNRSIKAQVANLLKEFSIKLRSTAKQGQQIQATVLLRHYRFRIANSLEASLKAFSSPEDQGHDNEDQEEEINPLRSDTGFTLDEKMGRFLSESLPPSATEETFDMLDVVEEDENEDYALSHFPDAWKFLTESLAYNWFLAKVKSAVLLTAVEDTASDDIGKGILKGLNIGKIPWQCSKNIVQATFNIDAWPLLEFLKEQYPEEQEVQLGSIITITGSDVDAQALTCAEYMNQVWPVTGAETLQALEEAVNEEIGAYANQYSMADGTKIRIHIKNSVVNAAVCGTEPAVVEIGQQLAWLSAALRSSPLSNRICCCTPKILLPDIERDCDFEISFLVEEISAMEREINANGSCWRPLFKNPVIVKGYPIMARLYEETGLEIPLNMMAGLGGASMVTNFDGGLLIKGFSTLFCPMKLIKGSVLWHYLFEKDGSRMSYLSADGLCSDRTRVDTVDKSCLQASRHFLGWTSSADCYAGTKDVKYEDIDWAGGNFASAGISFEKTSIMVGSYVSGGASFTRGSKDIPIYLGRGLGSPYQQEIHFAHNMKVVLYDVEQRRGWLVDGDAALLHLTRTQLSSSQSPCSESDVLNLEDFRHADPKGGICAAKKALLDPRNRKITIFEDVEVSVESRASKEEVKKTTRKWTFEDLVRQTYHILEQIHDYEGKMLTSPAVAMRFTDRDKLTGFAFMDIVKGRNDLRPRVATLKSSGRGWVDFTRSIRAISLFGNGFGEILMPADDSNKLCKVWRHVPLGKDYLVARTSTLQEICREDGNHDSKPMELANGVYWHMPDKLYEPCHCSHMSPCDRVQVLLPPSLGTKRHPQPFTYQNGAVIFGRSRRFPWRWPKKGDPVEGEQSDSEPDDLSGFQDSGLGDSNPSIAGESDSKNTQFSSSVSMDGTSGVNSMEVHVPGFLEHHIDICSRPIPEEAANVLLNVDVSLKSITKSVEQDNSIRLDTSSVGSQSTQNYGPPQPSELSSFKQAMKLEKRGDSPSKPWKRTIAKVIAKAPKLFA